MPGQGSRTVCNLVTLLLLLPLLAVSRSVPLFTRDDTNSTGHTSSGDEHIVLLARNHSYATHDAHAASVLDRLSLSPTHPDVRLLYNNSAFHGFAASMNSHCLDALATMADVSHVERATAIAPRHALPLTRRDSTRPASPWGLQRISSTGPITGDDKSMSFTYTYDEPTLGAGVDIYIVDTGINTAHTVFQSRARTGFSFESDTSDGDGHGTHVASTAAGTVFGVASAANLIAVKVLGADGSGSSADTISGMDYVLRTHDARKRDPAFLASIMSMSWGLSSISPAVSSAITAASAAGVHISLAAGNSGADACGASPSNTGGQNSASILTVGSIGPSGAVSSFSNTGACVDVYAPGEDVLSAWKDGPTTVNFLSGTSMACPHVTGTMATLIAAERGLAGDTAALKTRVLALARAGVLGNTHGGRAVMLSNGAAGRSAKREVAARDVGMQEWEVVRETSRVP